MTTGKMPSVVIGDAQSDHVRITIRGRLHSTSDYREGNWLVSPIEIRVGAFSAKLPAGIRAEELLAFRHALEHLIDATEGSATFESMEEWLSMRVVRNEKGGLAISCLARDNGGIGNELRFSIDGLDESSLPSIIDELAAINAAFPVIGTP